MFSPPLYDVPRSLLEGRSGQGESGQTGSGQGESGQTCSGQGESGQTISGQTVSGQERDTSPEMTYDVPKSLLEPPSPLMEFNQVGVVSCEVGVVCISKNMHFLTISDSNSSPGQSNPSSSSLLPLPPRPRGNGGGASWKRGGASAELPPRGTSSVYHRRMGTDTKRG